MKNWTLVQYPGILIVYLIDIRQTVRSPDVRKVTKLANIPGPVFALDLVNATIRSFRKDARACKTEAAPQTVQNRPNLGGVSYSWNYCCVWDIRAGSTGLFNEEAYLAV